MKGGERAEWSPAWHCLPTLVLGFRGQESQAPTGLGRVGSAKENIGTGLPTWALSQHQSHH